MHWWVGGWVGGSKGVMDASCPYLAAHSAQLCIARALPLDATSQLSSVGSSTATLSPAVYNSILPAWKISALALLGDLTSALGSLAVLHRRDLAGCVLEALSYAWYVASASRSLVLLSSPPLPRRFLLSRVLFSGPRLLRYGVCSPSASGVRNVAVPSVAEAGFHAFGRVVSTLCAGRHGCVSNHDAWAARHTALPSLSQVR